MVVYPEQVWYGSVQPGDVEEIVQEHILGGRIVERLIIADSCLNTVACPHKPAPVQAPKGEHGGPGSAEDIALSGVL